MSASGTDETSTTEHHLPVLSVATPVVEAFIAAALPFEIRHCELDADSPTSVRRAAASLGMDERQVFTAYGLQLGETAAIALAPAVSEVDPQACAAATGYPTAELLSPKLGEAGGDAGAEGSPVDLLGTVTDPPTPIIMDVSAMDWEAILIPTGQVDFYLEVSADDVLVVLTARAAPITFLATVSAASATGN